MPRADLRSSHFLDDEVSDGPRNVGLLAIRPPYAAVAREYVIAHAFVCLTHLAAAQCNTKNCLSTDVHNHTQCWLPDVHYTRKPGHARLAQCSGMRV